MTTPAVAPEPSETRAPQRVNWIRCKVEREQLSELNRRSDFLGFVQTLGYLGLLALNGALAYYSAYHWPWYVTVLLVYWHGTCWHFLINGFHELIHESVFRTRWLNGFFLRVFSFLGWYNHHHFWASHTEHHKYTLHPPDDLEVVLPVKLTWRGFWQGALLNPRVPYWLLKGTLKTALGRIDPQDRWTQILFPADQPRRRRLLRNWALLLLLGHGLIAGVALYFDQWMVPILVTFPLAYGGALHWLCNNSQHVGLADNVNDFRLCCRTIYLNPLFQFLYWHMNYHTEHHMFAAVPCYKLPRLHRLIKDQMPPCPNGLYATWVGINAILKQQREDPAYQYVAPAPPIPGRGNAEDNAAEPTPALG